MEKLRSFNVDFNWINISPAPADAFCRADAAQLADWYKEMGCNNFWTFAISYNGCAWYDSLYAPKVNGLQGNFCKDCVEEGHKRGMSVFAYHNLAANPVIEKAHPEWTRKNPDDFFHLILCDEYLDWFCKAVQESITVCGYDGLVIDWFRCPRYRLPEWEPKEKELYRRLMGTPLPASPTKEEIAAFEKASVEHAWKRIRAAVRAVGDTPIWTNHPFDFAENPVWNGNLLLKEADFVLNESPDCTLLNWLRREAGPHTRIVQNICGWANHNLDDMPADVLHGYDLFGFAAASPQTCLPFTKEEIERIRRENGPAGEQEIRKLTANQKNIDGTREIFRRVLESR